LRFCASQYEGLLTAGITVRYSHGMSQPRKSPPQSIASFRERRLAVGRSIRDLENETGIHRGRLSPIERGMTPSLVEHQAIETALSRWEASAQ
jgi:transcriptional regulator with XRE-family HTH domain